ncbi:ABC transporter permease [Pseudorhodoferax sp.]|uniref:ABC transporter permease n=1 Tax=Pseudorhodoferax sp. TaxID=1993553 RepID=UPI002DD68E10|nr:ABC transporter permease [Pseudorhodoferax sp.]
MNATAARLLVPVLVFTGSGTASAHEVHHTVARAEATVVTLQYADDTPFAGETFELMAAGSDTPLLTGRTDTRGRAVLLLDGPGPWRLRAFSDDGHGVDRVITAQAGQASAAAPSTTPAEAPFASPDRNSRIVFGLGLLLALFGIIQIVLRRRDPH